MSASAIQGFNAHIYFVLRVTCNEKYAITHAAHYDNREFRHNWIELMSDIQLTDVSSTQVYHPLKILVKFQTIRMLPGNFLSYIFRHIG